MSDTEQDTNGATPEPVPETKQFIPEPKPESKQSTSKPETKPPKPETETDPNQSVVNKVRVTKPDLKDGVKVVSEILQPEDGRSLCLVAREGGLHCGYRLDILTEHLSNKENNLLVCPSCKGIMRDACLSSSGEQFCGCCKEEIQANPNLILRNIICSVNCSCPLVERGCGWLGTLGGVENHLDTCVYVLETCKLACGEVLQRDKHVIHENDECLQRIVNCMHCNEDFGFHQMDIHLEMCSKMEITCELYCGEVLCRENMAQHLIEYCVKVEEECNLGCGIKLTRAELEVHMLESCIQRIVTCEHCKKEFNFCDLSDHLEMCPNVKVSCELCGVVVCREGMTQHLERDCTEKEIECPFVKYKCEAVVIKRKELKIHLEENRMEHTELKLNTMENIIVKQSKIISKLTELNGVVMMQCKELIAQNEKIEQLESYIHVLASIPNATKLEWRIENITNFIKINHPPQPRQVSGYTLNFHFLKEYIYVNFDDVHESNNTAVSAEYLVRLYSTRKCEMIKTYDSAKIWIFSKSDTGTNMKQIARIAQSDIDEFSRKGVATKLTLEILIS